MSGGTPTHVISVDASSLFATLSRIEKSAEASANKARGLDLSKVFGKNETAAKNFRNSIEFLQRQIQSTKLEIERMGGADGAGFADSRQLDALQSHLKKITRQYMELDKVQRGFAAGASRGLRLPKSDVGAASANPLVGVKMLQEEGKRRAAIEKKYAAASDKVDRTARKATSSLDKLSDMAEGFSLDAKAAARGFDDVTKALKRSSAANRKVIDTAQTRIAKRARLARMPDYSTSADPAAKGMSAMDNFAERMASQWQSSFAKIGASADRNAERAVKASQRVVAATEKEAQVKAKLAAQQRAQRLGPQARAAGRIEAEKRARFSESAESLSGRRQIVAGLNEVIGRYKQRVESLSRGLEVTERTIKQIGRGTAAAASLEKDAEGLRRSIRQAQAMVDQKEFLKGQVLRGNALRGSDPTPERWQNRRGDRDMERFGRTPKYESSFAKAEFGGTFQRRQGMLGAMGAMPNMKPFVSGLKGAVGLMGKLSSGAGAVGSAIGGAFTGASFAAWKLEQSFNMIVGGLRAIVDVAKEGEGLKNIDVAFSATAEKAGVSIEQLRAATKGAVSDKMLKQMAAFASQSEISAENIIHFAEAAVGSAMTKGKGIDEMFRRYVLGTAKQEKELLDETGTLVKNAAQIWSDYAKEKGVAVKDLTAQDKQLAYQNEVRKASQKNVDFARENKGSTDIASAATKIENAFDQAKLSVAQFVVDLGLIDKILPIFDQIASAFSGEEFGAFFALAADTAAEGIKAIIGVVKALLPSMGVLLPLAKGFFKVVQAGTPVIASLVMIMTTLAKATLPVILNAIGLAVEAIGELGEAVGISDGTMAKMGVTLQEAGDDIANMDDEINTLAGDMDGLSESTSGVAENMDAAAGSMFAFNDSVEDTGKKAMEAALQLGGIEGALLAIETVTTRTSPKLQQLQADLKAILDLGNKDYASSGGIGAGNVDAANRSVEQMQQQRDLLRQMQRIGPGQNIFETPGLGGGEANPMYIDPAVWDTPMKEWTEATKKKVESAQEARRVWQDAGLTMSDTMDTDLGNKIAGQIKVLESADRGIASAMEDAGMASRKADSMTQWFIGENKKLKVSIELAHGVKRDGWKFIAGLEQTAQEQAALIRDAGSTEGVGGEELISMKKLESYMPALTEDPYTKEFDPKKTEKNFHAARDAVFRIGKQAFEYQKDVKEANTSLATALKSGDEETIKFARANLDGAKSRFEAMRLRQEEWNLLADTLETRLGIEAKKKKAKEKKIQKILYELLDTSQMGVLDSIEGARKGKGVADDFMPTLLSDEADIILEGNTDDIEKYRDKIRTIQDQFLSASQELSGLMSSAETIEQFNRYAEQHGALEASIDAVKGWFPDKGKVQAVEKKMKTTIKWWEKKNKFVEKMQAESRRTREKLAALDAEMKQQREDLISRQREVQIASSDYMDATGGLNIDFYEMSMKGDPEEDGVGLKTYEEAIANIPQHMLDKAFSFDYERKLVEYKRAEEAVRAKTEQERERLKQEIKDGEKGGKEYDQSVMEQRFRDIDDDEATQLAKINTDRMIYEQELKMDAAMQWAEQKKQMYTAFWSDMGREAGDNLGYTLGAGLADALDYTYEYTMDWSEKFEEIMGNLFMNVGGAISELAAAEIMLMTGNPIGAALAGGAVMGFARALSGMFNRKNEKTDVEKVADRELRRKREKREENFTVNINNNGVSMSNQQAREMAALIAMQKKYKAA